MEKCKEESNREKRRKGKNRSKMKLEGSLKAFQVTNNERRRENFFNHTAKVIIRADPQICCNM